MKSFFTAFALQLEWEAIGRLWARKTTTPFTRYTIPLQNARTQEAGGDLKRNNMMLIAKVISTWLIYSAAFTPSKREACLQLDYSQPSHGWKGC